MPDKKRRGILEPRYECHVDVPDQPGVIGKIATLLGNENINISNLEVMENREEIPGVLKIAFKKEKDYLAAISVLRRKDWKYSVRTKAGRKAKDDGNIAVETVSINLKVPGDKSISHRSIMLGALAEGVTEVEGFLPGKDCLGTLQCFEQMGVEIERLSPTSVRIHGRGIHGLKEPVARWMWKFRHDHPVDAGNIRRSAVFFHGDR